MKIGNRIFDLYNHTYVMGILNVTPDSFSDGGQYTDKDAALKRALQMAEEGADIIDIGGESTRPGYTPVSAEIQIERVIPIIKEIKKKIDIPVSVDTYDAKVARAALEAGCDIVNDIWGLRKDPDMAKAIAEYDAFCVLMHNRETPDYNNFMTDVLADCAKMIGTAVNAGIKEEKIIIDPGVGFGKTLEQNLCVIKYLEDFKNLDVPVLLGTSRKSVIGLTLDLPVEERLEGTLATTVMAVMKGINFVRVHDIKENVRTIKMTEAIMNSFVPQVNEPLCIYGPPEMFNQ
ncbi:MAG: dihydropteroate synthase [Lachnospiraceae bacterium]|nr:dihydropteroate synthase [Lachnospiraceae bacterium]